LSSAVFFSQDSSTKLWVVVTVHKGNQIKVVVDRYSVILSTDKLHNVWRIEVGWDFGLKLTLAYLAAIAIEADRSHQIHTVHVQLAFLVVGCEHIEDLFVWTEPSNFVFVFSSNYFRLLWARRGPRLMPAVIPYQKGGC